MDRHPVVMTDAAGEIRHWSVGAEKSFGYLAIHAVGQTLDLIVPPEYRAAHWIGFRRAMESGKADVDQQSTEFPVLHADGAVVPCRGQVTLLRNAERGVIGALVVFDAPTRQD